MKKIFYLLFLNFNFINYLVACNVNFSKNQNKENDPKIIIPEQINERKWYYFYKKIGQIAFDYYSVETEIVAQTFKNMCETDNRDDICWELLLKNLGINEKSPYWKIEKKIFEYKELRKEYYSLPNINNIFKSKVNKVFKTIEFWIIYRIFLDDNKKEQEFIEIFNITDWKQNKQNIMTKLPEINILFNIDWEYKIREEDMITKDKWIETYIENTQIKLFEIIAFHKYIEILFENEISDYQSKGYNEKIHYMKLIEFEDYINIKKYQHWIRQNQNKPGYGVWQEMNDLLIN